MALIVDIYVNDRRIKRYAAIRIKGGTNPDDINTYQLFETGDKITHRYGDGAEALVEKMMAIVKEKPHG
jgi:hypothetical protein